MEDEIERIPQIISLSRRTLRVVRQNVIFSMSMTLLSLTLASLGMIGPVVGALMHETSSLPVLANSARLVDASYRRPKTGRQEAGGRGIVAQTTVRR